MFPNLDFIKTMLSGITVSFEKAIKAVERKIVTPDYKAEEGQPGYIKNKPVVVGKPGSGEGSVVFGHPDNIADGKWSFVEGGNSSLSSNVCKATGWSAHAEGASCTASGDYSHAEGYYSHAEGYCSHAEGYNGHAEGSYSHAEGYYSHAEGSYSHAEGYKCTASGVHSHAEGCLCTASGDYSHAEGEKTKASGYHSHAEGKETEARQSYQHVQGRYNIIDTGHIVDGFLAPKYIHIVGNGISEDKRSNAHTLDLEGNAWFAGDIYIGGTGQDDPNAKRLIDAVIEALPGYNGEVESA